MTAGGDEWGHMMSSAAKLKQAQNDQDRTIWNRWPQHVQHTLFHGGDEEVTTARDAVYKDRVEAAWKFRKTGNDEFKEFKLQDAIHSYEKAYACFDFITCSEPDYKTKGIKDRWMTLHEFEAVEPCEDTNNLSKEEQMGEVSDFKVACVLNLTACYLKMKDWDNAIKCATCALESDPKNVKALYRRAEARIGPKQHGQLEEDQAIADLKKAVTFSEPGSAQFRSCGALLGKLTTSKQDQRKKDQKQFSGFFDRGSISDKYDGTAAVEQEKMQLEQRIRDAESLFDVYRKNGQLGEADALRKNIRTAKRALKKGHGSYDPVDYNAPSEKMVKDAKQFGIDLTDPRVLQELNRMEQARREGKDVEQMLREDAKTHTDLEAEAKRNLAKQNEPKKEMSFKKVRKQI